MLIHEPVIESAEAVGSVEPALSVRNLTVLYDQDAGIEEVSFDVYPGEKVAVIGPNGAGKSTLMKAIMGLLQPRAGEIKAHRTPGYVPQYEAVNWDFPVTVGDVVMMGRIRRIGWLMWPRRADWQAVDAALDRVGLSDLAGRQIGELSGGQRRRVFIARALVQEAEVLILDEPFSGVDASAQVEMMAVLDTLQKEGMTILLSTHDLGLAFQRFDRVLALRYRLVAYGSPNTVYTPEVLAAVYGGSLAALDNGQHVTVFVDDHQCC
ncbi:MAG: metal ABC transporter ATP-binding protein [Anaerolineae bacterium]|nr:metal ABC transporter ATP-binding protein [Anaerolineae bacterium]